MGEVYLDELCVTGAVTLPRYTHATRRGIPRYTLVAMWCCYNDVLGGTG